MLVFYFKHPWSIWIPVQALSLSLSLFLWCTEQIFLYLCPTCPAGLKWGGREGSEREREREKKNWPEKTVMAVRRAPRLAAVRLTHVRGSPYSLAASLCSCPLSIDIPYANLLPRSFTSRCRCRSCCSSLSLCVTRLAASTAISLNRLTTFAGQVCIQTIERTVYCVPILHQRIRLIFCGLGEAMIYDLWSSWCKR